MTQKTNNPFLVSGYNGPDYFCDREIEAADLISALKNGRNIALISPRRIGKTGLIHHVFNYLHKKDSSIRCFYIDIFSTQSLADFVTLFGQSVLGQLDTFSEKTAKNLTAFFKSIRPTFSFDSISGNPKVSFDVQPQRTQETLSEIFAYLNESKKEIYIALDEFQQITEYPEKGTEALLRSHIQFLPNVRFIFSGSKKHLMDAMFSSINRPFYRSTQIMNLYEIPIDTYRQFAQDLFQKHSKQLDAAVFDYVYNKMWGHTWYIQVLLNQLFYLENNASKADVEMLLSKILKEEESVYKTYCDLITKGQLRVLKAIAIEGKVSKPYESGFIKRHQLTAPSSIKATLTSLIDKSLILKDEKNNYLVYDRFFSIWLERT